jgi:hypothetical protein
MKLRILVVAAVVVGVALVPATAWAKGAREVTITGPGIHGPVRLENTADGPEVVDVNRLAEATGLFDAAFGAAPTRMTDTRPRGKLGPRYRAVYGFLVGQDEVVPIRQDLYPFAAAGFVSHTPRGQQLFQQTVQSGWYVTTDSYDTGIDGKSATEMLVALGARDHRGRSVRAARR